MSYFMTKDEREEAISRRPKDEERAELEKQIKQFKKAGGKIKKIKSGLGASDEKHKQVSRYMVLK